MCIHVVGNEELGTLSNRNCYCVAIGTGTQSFTDTHYTSPCDHVDCIHEQEEQEAVVTSADIPLSRGL
jgi:hypothetical protein